MDALEAIMSRKSVRKFSGKMVSDSEIKKILEAAMAAPSARNQQPWHFIVVKDKEQLIRLSESNPYVGMAKEAALAIIVCGDLNLEKSKGFWPIDCANASQNILLAAHALGLGAVWTALYPRDDRIEGARKVLGFPENIIPLNIIPIGHPAEKKEAENRYDEKRLHADRW
ncbi:nitroreductase family protein [Candidatus Micrarchaeota archaeon]|nr:nitroreductase family protein [Candidatus Micrarchaeota archaeon]